MDKGGAYAWNLLKKRDWQVIAIREKKSLIQSFGGQLAMKFWWLVGFWVEEDVVDMARWDGGRIGMKLSAIDAVVTLEKRLRILACCRPICHEILQACAPSSGLSSEVVCGVERQLEMGGLAGKEWLPFLSLSLFFSILFFFLPSLAKWPNKSPRLCHYALI